MTNIIHLAAKLQNLWPNPSSRTWCNPVHFPPLHPTVDRDPEIKTRCSYTKAHSYQLLSSRIYLYAPVQTERSRGVCWPRNIISVRQDRLWVVGAPPGVARADALAFGGRTLRECSAVLCKWCDGAWLTWCDAAWGNIMQWMWYSMVIWWRNVRCRVWKLTSAHSGSWPSQQQAGPFGERQTHPDMGGNSIHVHLHERPHSPLLPGNTENATPTSAHNTKIMLLWDNLISLFWLCGSALQCGTAKHSNNKEKQTSDLNSQIL